MKLQIGMIYFHLLNDLNKLSVRIRIVRKLCPFYNENIVGI